MTQKGKLTIFHLLVIFLSIQPLSVALNDILHNHCSRKVCQTEGQEQLSGVV